MTENFSFCINCGCITDKDKKRQVPELFNKLTGYHYLCEDCYEHLKDTNK